MTRGHVKSPVWAWCCDECGLVHRSLAFLQRDLPSPDEMRASGWFIAETWGDKCPMCAKKP